MRLVDESALLVKEEEHRLLVFRLDNLHRVFLRVEVRDHTDEVSPLLCQLKSI